MTRWTFAPVAADPTRTGRDRLRLLCAQILTGAVLFAAMSWLTVPVASSAPVPPVTSVVVVTPHKFVKAHREIVNTKTYNDGTVVVTTLTPSP